MAAEKKYSRRKPRMDAPITLNTWQLIVDEIEASDELKASPMGKMMLHLAAMVFATNTAASLIEYPEGMDANQKLVILSAEINRVLDEQEQLWSDMPAIYRSKMREEKANIYSATYGWYRKGVLNSANRGTEPTVQKGTHREPRTMRDQQYTQRECVGDVGNDWAKEYGFIDDAGNPNQ